MLLPQSIYYFVGRILTGIGQIVMIRVLTSILNPSELGKYYLLMSFVASISLFFISPVSMYISRHYYGWYQIGIGWAVIKKFFVYLLILSAISVVVLFVLNPFHLVGEKFSYGILCVFIPLLIIGTTTSSCPQELLNIIGRSRTFVLLNNLELWGKIGFIYIFSLLLYPMAVTVLGALTLWSILFSIPSGMILFKCVRSMARENSFTLGAFKEIFNFAWPFSIAAAFYWCQSEGYRFVLQHVSSLDVVGKFVVGFSLGAAPILVLEGIFSQLYMPIYYREISVETIESHTEAWNRYFQKVVRVFVPSGLYVAFAGPFLVYWLLHSTYWNVGICAAFGAISQLFRIFSGAVNNGLIARKQTRSMLVPNMIGAVLALIGTFVFASKHPMIGTGIALILSYASVSIGLYLKLSNKIHIHIPFADIFRSAFLIAPACIILAISSKFGFVELPILNMMTLIITGTIFLYAQYSLSKDVWLFKR